MALDPVVVSIVASSIAFLLFAILIIVLLRGRNRASSKDDNGLATTLQILTQTVQQGQTQIATLTEKVNHVEQKQSDISNLTTGLAQQSTQTLIQVGTGLNGEITKIQNDLATLQAIVKSREEMERRTADSIKRLESIIAGTQSKGVAGENILEAVFSKLPPDWQVRNFTIGGKHVEFGLRLPNNLILPIDSKWTATDLLEQFIASDNVDDQIRLKGEIESAVIQKAKEVKKYIDPSVTVSFGVAVVPDAIYDLCGGIQAEAFKMSVVIVSYGLFVPYLLLVFQTILKSEQSIDMQKLSANLQTVQNGIATLQDEIDGRFSKALTMLSNSRDDMRAHLSKASSSVTGLQLATSNESSVVIPS